MVAPRRRTRRVVLKAVTHPTVGDLYFDSTLLQGTDTAAKLKRLLAQQNADRD